MSTKKLVISIIIILILFTIFIRFAFQSLQTVKFKQATFQLDAIPDTMIDVVDFLNQYKDYEFEKEFSLDKIQIILVDHQNEKAILWNDKKDKGNKSIRYEEIPDNIKYANSFFVVFNNYNTLVINCDSILDDTRERIVVDSYKYLYLQQNKLNPNEVSYFSSHKENLKERFLRNCMIDTLLEANTHEIFIEDFRQYFELWQTELGENYKNIAEYDWYEGNQEYIRVKVKSLVNQDFDLETYVESQINDYNFYNKEDEYRLIGLLMILYAEKMDYPLYHPSQMQNDIYRNLLINTPYIVTSFDEEKYKIFEIEYSNYLLEMESVSSDIDSSSFKANIFHDDIISETYEHTYKIENNLYIYLNYQGRLKNNDEISTPYIYVKVSPYQIAYSF